MNTLFTKLRKNNLFTSVSDTVIQNLIPHISELSFKAGEYIFKQGDLHERLCLVAKGKVGIEGIDTETGERLVIIRIGESDFFGELELIDGIPRSADAYALEDSEILFLDNDNFHKLIHENPVVAFNIMQQLSVRLRMTNKIALSELHIRTLDRMNRLNRMTQLVEAAKSVNSSLNLDDVLDLILKTNIRMTQADRGTLYLVDNERREIWSKLLHGEHVGEIRLPLGKGIAGFVAETGNTINIEDTYEHPAFNPEIDQRTGYHTHSMLCMPIRNRGGVIIGVIQLLNKKEGLFDRQDEEFIEGMSAHASIAIENARLAREMINNERLLAVGRVASTIIHDLKSPINTIKLYTQVLQKSSGSEEAIGIAGEVTQQADRLIKMVQEILDYTRGESKIDLKEINVGELLNALFRFINREFKEKNIVIDMDLRYDGSWLLDADKMLRVFHNIASNAADAMPGGGAFIISTEADGNTLSISFHDTGAGIPDEVKVRLFEPFFTHGKKYGTGLGMSIVKKIVEDHNGRISVESEKGKGTTFTIELPGKV